MSIGAVGDSVVEVAVVDVFVPVPPGPPVPPVPPVAAVIVSVPETFVMV